MATEIRKPSIGLFPASFDPVTNGHLDLIQRARKVFDQVVVGVATNVDKRATFSVEERLEMLHSVVDGWDGVTVDQFDGLLVHHAEKLGATAVIRGLRASVDFEYEFEMALMNKHLQPEIEVLFLMSSLEHLYVSSSRLKELVRFGANIDDFVPPVVAKKLREKLGAA